MCGGLPLKCRKLLLHKICFSAERRLLGLSTCRADGARASLQFSNAVHASHPDGRVLFETPRSRNADPDAVDVLLSKMVKGGELTRVGTGRYAL